MSVTPNRCFKQVLLVDDEVSLLRMLERVLRRAGYGVQCAENGREGLQYFQQAFWDVVIIDRSMPEMNGEELARVIKTSSPNVPLIMITGFRDAITHPLLFDFILAKPFHPADLLACLSRTLQKDAELLLTHDSPV